MHNFDFLRLSVELRKYQTALFIYLFIMNFVQSTQT